MVHREKTSNDTLFTQNSQLGVELDSMASFIHLESVPSIVQFIHHFQEPTQRTLLDHKTLTRFDETLEPSIDGQQCRCDFLELSAGRVPRWVLRVIPRQKDINEGHYDKPL